MKLLVCFALILSVALTCGENKTFKPRHFSSVEIKTLLQDSLLNIRAIELNAQKLIGISSNGNRISMFLNDEKSISQVESANSENFRASALLDDTFFSLTIGSPARLYKNDVLVYEEIHPKVFYDAMDFWNNQEGIAIGDSTDGCLSVIITRDGGATWTKLSCDKLPKGIENEGAFAASDTNIAIVGNKTWVATTAGRIYYSEDKGHNWSVFETPIVKQKDTEGIYSVDFYDALKGFAIGGDYTEPDANKANKMSTTDGGKTWQLVAQIKNPGYRSCVQYLPNRAGKELVAVGIKGIDYSNDAGYSWTNLSDEGFYTIRFLNDSVAYAAGAGRVSKLTFR